MKVIVVHGKSNKTTGQTLPLSLDNNSFVDLNYIALTKLHVWLSTEIALDLQWIYLLSIWKIYIYDKFYTKKARRPLSYSQNCITNIASYLRWLGGSVWKGPKQQRASNVQTRVRVWGEQHYPPPDFTQDWERIKIGNHIY